MFKLRAKLFGFKGQRTRTMSIALLLVLAGVSLTACDSGNNGTDSTNGLQGTTDKVQKQLDPNGSQYPLAQMHNSDEIANLRERLLRMNDPNKIGYVYELTQNGQIIAQYTVKGKVSSTQSQILNSQMAYDCGTNCGTTLESMGDDGSYGTEEGGENGIFFFTTSGVMVEWNGIWQYSDAPLNLTSKPLITINADAKPSSNAGQLGK
jgi:hypothetical protein